MLQYCFIFQIFFPRNFSAIVDTSSTEDNSQYSSLADGNEDVSNYDEIRFFNASENGEIWSFSIKFVHWLFESFISGTLEIVKDFIEQGGNVDLKDKFKRTALHYSCMNGQDEIVQYLVDHNASINLVDFLGMAGMLVKMVWHDTFPPQNHWINEMLLN